MIHLNHRRSPCHSKNIKGPPLHYILFKTRTWTPSWISYYVPHPHFLSEVVICLLPTSDALISFNKKNNCHLLTCTIQPHAFVFYTFLRLPVTFCWSRPVGVGFTPTPYPFTCFYNNVGVQWLRLQFNYDVNNPSFWIGRRVSKGFLSSDRDQNCC